MYTMTRSIHGVGRVLGIGVLMMGGTVSQTAGQFAPQPQEVPQDVRIMQTIVGTALSEVEAPPLPEEPAGDSILGRGTGENMARTLESLAYYGAPGSFSFGRGDVSGFYMRGYGYLFTVRFQVSSTYVYARVLGTAEGQSGALPGMVASSPSEAGSAWAREYRQRLSDALRDAIALYGSTLRRAGPGESITFIADFGGGDAETVTMAVRADALQGSNLEANRAAIRVSSGQSEVSEELRTQLRIMSQIIDTALRSDASAGGLDTNTWNAYFGGEAKDQYVPGYGVIFRKTARLNTARAFAGLPGASPREAVDSLERTARATYRAHLDTLRERTAAVLAVYGPTLTQLKDDDWVGIYFDVGSAASLLNEGMDDYLVQARMRDIRQAAAQSDPESWLRNRLVTNERGD